MKTNITPASDMDDFRLGSLAISSDGSIAVVDPSEDATRIRVFGSDGEPGLPDVEHHVPLEAQALVPLGRSEFLVVSMRGEIAEVSETVALRDELPLRHGNEHLIAGATRIGGRVFVTSLSGELLARSDDGLGTWTTVCGPLDSPGEHVWSIGGSDSGVFAVGSGIWRRHGKKWRNLQAPRGNYTNLTFQDGELVTFREKSIVRGGDDGTWNDEPLELYSAIHDVCCFQDTLYVAADQALHTFEGGQLHRVPEIEGCTILATNGDILVAATASALHCLAAGHWLRIW